MTDNIFKPILASLAESRNLTREQAERAFQIIMNGGATPAQMGAFILGLRAKGETFEELVAGAKAMRAKMKLFTTAVDSFDTCGTGGDNQGSMNISTAVAIVLAGCGVSVVKHGSHAVSSQSGSADVLKALGVNIDADASVMQRALAECNLAFLLAPRYHPAMRHVAPVRQELGLRSIFNLLGPLCNPAQPAYQLMGVFARQWQQPMAQALHELGAKRAWVVHGIDGMDELTLAGISYVTELYQGEIRQFEITPEAAGITSNTAHGALAGGNPAQNAKLLLDAISGMKGAGRDAVVYNAAAGLVISGNASDLMQGAGLAATAIDDGLAHGTLMKLMNISRSG